MMPEDFVPVLSIIAMIVLMVMASRVAAGIQRSRNARAVAAARRLGVYTGHGRGYQMFIGFKGHEHDLAATGLVVPRSSDPGHRWLPIQSADEEGVILENGTRVPLEAVESFVVAYPGGRIIDANAPFEPLPPGLHFPEPTPAMEEDILHRGDLAASADWLVVEFGPPEFPDPIPERWRIRLTNSGPEAIRIVSFGIYDCDGDECILATESGVAYSAEEFLEWFHRGEDPWLEPGESAEDPNGFGRSGQVWAFYFETQSGEDRLAGGVIPD